MKKMLLFLSFFATAFADKWTIKRDPFTVSNAYIQQTRQSFLEPKSNYIPFEITLLGITAAQGRKEAVLDIEFEGIRELKERETITVKTPDIESHLKLLWIGENAVKISVNGGEGVHYAIH